MGSEGGDERESKALTRHSDSRCLSIVIYCHQMTWAFVTVVWLHPCPEALVPVTAPSLAPLADCFSGLLTTRFKAPSGCIH